MGEGEEDSSISDVTGFEFNVIICCGELSGVSESDDWLALAFQAAHDLGAAESVDSPSCTWWSCSIWDVTVDVSMVKFCKKSDETEAFFFVFEIRVVRKSIGFCFLTGSKDSVLCISSLLLCWDSSSDSSGTSSRTGVLPPFSSARGVEFPSSTARLAKPGPSTFDGL